MKDFVLQNLVEIFGRGQFDTPGFRPERFGMVQTNVKVVI